MSPSSRKRKPVEQRDSDDGDGEGDGDDADESSGLLNDDEVHWGKVYNPGKITVSDPSHRRLIEETGNADNPRVEFVGDAAKLDTDDSNNDGSDNE